jgi:hypothetical protein
LNASLKKSQSKRIPIGLAQVRKELPPPGKVFKSKKTDSRQRSKEDLRQKLKADLSRESS